jgi:hypothetical protein
MNQHALFGDITRITGGRSRRASSWDQTGGNDDCILILPGETAVLADIEGPGRIGHIYFTLIDPHPFDYRDAILRMYWDGEETPSVEVPFGDFFCIGHCTVRHFSSLMMAVNPGANLPGINNGVNCYFPMPFATGARITLENQSPRPFGGAMGRCWYHIDYEIHDAPPPPDTGRFHAQWRRENPTTVGEIPVIPARGAFPACNLTGADNYVMLEARGQGHIAGLFLQVDNITGGWYGEGDDMIFIDGDTWPPSIHGTGSEEIFGGGACPDKEYAGDHTGYVLIENRDGKAFGGKNAMYRWYLNDPVRFTESARMTIEHGHANDLANDYASVVYWYQTEPHAPFPAMPPVVERRPRVSEAFLEAQELHGRLCNLLVKYQEPFVFESIPVPAWLDTVKRHVGEGYVALHKGQDVEAREAFGRAVEAARANGDEV